MFMNLESCMSGGSSSLGNRCNSNCSWICLFWIWGFLLIFTKPTTITTMMMKRITARHMRALLRFWQRFDPHISGPWLGDAADGGWEVEKGILGISILVSEKCSTVGFSALSWLLVYSMQMTNIKLFL